MTKCLKCGSDTPENAHFCPGCGVAIPLISSKGQTRQEPGSFCQLCGHSQPEVVPDKIEIKESPDGFLLEAVVYCQSCGALIDWGKSLPVEFKELKCPSCNEVNLNLAFKEIKETKGGYVFSALLKCGNRKCSWKNNLKTGLRSTKEIASSIKKFKISTTGIEIER